MRRQTSIAAMALLVLGIAAGSTGSHPASVPSQAAERDLGEFWTAALRTASTTGSEHLLARLVADALAANPPVSPDAFGTVTIRAGEGPPALAIVAPLDGYGWFVSGIDPDGRLRLDRPVPPPEPRFDAWLLGRPVVVSTRGGLLQGVVAQPAMHLLTRERRQAQVEEFDLEDAYVDIHARSEAEVLGRGVAQLDAVAFRPGLTRLAGGRQSGPSMGLAGCVAALTSAAAGSTPDGGTALVFAAQTKALVRGRGARRSLGVARSMNALEPQAVIVLETIEAATGDAEGTPDKGSAPRLGGGPVLLGSAAGESSLLRQAVARAARISGIPLQRAAAPDSPMLAAAAADGADTLGLAVPVRYLHTPAETVAAVDVEALRVILRLLVEGGAR